MTAINRKNEAMDVAILEGLLREAELQHGAYEAIAPKHHWSSWYASYVGSRQKGNAAERASTDAGLYTEYVAPDRARRRAGAIAEAVIDVNEGAT